MQISPTFLLVLLCRCFLPNNARYKILVPLDFLLSLGSPPHNAGPYWYNPRLTLLGTWFAFNFLFASRSSWIDYNKERRKEDESDGAYMIIVLCLVVTVLVLAQHLLWLAPNSLTLIVAYLNGRGELINSKTICSTWHQESTTGSRNIREMNIRLITERCVCCRYHCHWWYILSWWCPFIMSQGLNVFPFFHTVVVIWTLLFWLTACIDSSMSLSPQILKKGGTLSLPNSVGCMETEHKAKQT